MYIYIYYICNQKNRKYQWSKLDIEIPVCQYVICPLYKYYHYYIYIYISDIIQHGSSNLLAKAKSVCVSPAASPSSDTKKNTNPRWTRHTHPNPLVHHHFPHKIWYHLGGPMIRPNICRNLIILRQSLSIWAIAQVAQVKLHKIQVVCVVCLYSLNLNIPLHI